MLHRTEHISQLNITNGIRQLKNVLFRQCTTRVFDSDVDLQVGDVARVAGAEEADLEGVAPAEPLLKMPRSAETAELAVDHDDESREQRFALIRTAGNR